MINIKTDGDKKNPLTPVNHHMKTREQRNIAEKLEAFMIQSPSFDTMLSITANVTSDTHWTGTVKVFDEGFYIQLVGTRSQASGFLDNDGNLIRKPRNITAIEVWDVQGTRTEIQSAVKVK